MFLNGKHWALLLVFLCPLAVAEALSGVHLEITTYLGDAQTFEQGDEVAFMLSLDRPAYIYLYYQDASHQMIQLLPNRQQRNNHYQPGLFIPVPDPQAGIQFIVQAPYGEEKLWAFASDQKIDIKKGKVLPNGLIQMVQGIDRIKKQIRQQSTSIFDQASLSLETSPRR